MKSREVLAKYGYLEEYYVPYHSLAYHRKTREFYLHLQKFQRCPYALSCRVKVFEKTKKPKTNKSKFETSFHRYQRLESNEIYMDVRYTNVLYDTKTGEPCVNL